MKNRNFLSLFFIISVALAGNSLFALQIISMQVNALNQLVIGRSGEGNGKSAFEIGVVVFNKGISPKYIVVNHNNKFGSDTSRKLIGMGFKNGNVIGIFDTDTIEEQKKYQSTQYTLEIKTEQFGVYPTYVKLNGELLNQKPLLPKAPYSKFAVDPSGNHIAMFNQNKNLIEFFHKDHADCKGIINNIKKVSAMAFLNNSTLVTASEDNTICILPLNINGMKIEESNLSPRKSYLITSLGTIVEANQKELEEEKQRKDKEKIEESKRKQQEKESSEEEQKAGNASWLSNIKLSSFITPKTIFCGGVIAAAILFAYYKKYLA